MRKITDVNNTGSMAEWSKALRSGRSQLMLAWVQISLLSNFFCSKNNIRYVMKNYLTALGFAPTPVFTDQNTHCVSCIANLSLAP